MKNRWCLVLTSSALLAGLAAPAEGQSLAEAARREAARRAKLTTVTKVYTSADIEGASFLRAAPSVTLSKPEAVQKPAAEAGAPPTAAAAAASGAEQKAELPAVRNKRDEEHWRERAKVIRDRLNRLESDATAFEQRVTDIQTQLESAPPAQAAALRAELQQTTQELTRTRAELRLIQDDWRTFEERARAAKIPAAWIR